MNKTIIININGIVFHIEEDAYEILRKYMTEVQRHFAYTAGSEEIVSDIENRIAEMFVEKLEEDKKQVIVTSDVQSIIAQMGQVSDFELDGDDAAFVAPETSTKQERKLFRDTDDRIVGGVCSGIGHYFDVEAKWVRLLIVIFIFAGGSSLLIYAIIWAITPAAKTRADRMAMKGEEPNLQNFKKNFDEELEALNDNLKRAHHKARPALEEGIRDFFTGLASFVNTVLKGVVKLIASFIIIAGIFGLIAMIVVTFGMFGWNSEFDTFPFNALNPEYKGMIFFSAFIIGVIPVLALIFFAIRVVFNKALINKTGSFVMLIIWIVGVCMGAYYGTKLGSEFKTEASFSEAVDLKPMPVYYLKMEDKKYLTDADSARYSFFTRKRNVVINNSDDDFNPENSNRVHIYIERSDVGKPILVKTYSSQGRDFDTALKLAQEIKFNVSQIDSVINIDRRVRISKDVLWRNQEVKLVLRVPINAKIVYDWDTAWHVRDFDSGRCQTESDKGRLKFVMTDTGLQCDTLVKR